MPHFSFIPIIDFIKPDYGLWNESVIEAENGNCIAAVKELFNDGAKGKKGNKRKVICLFF